MTRRANGEGSKPVQRADGRWQVHVRHTDEHDVSHRTTVYGRTPTEARKKAKTVRERLGNSLPAKDARETVSAFTETWIVSALAASDRKRNTKVLYAGVARKHILGSRLGGTGLDRVRPMHVESWIVELRAKGLSESTVRTAYTILRAVLDTAVRDGALGVNPAAAIKRPKVTSKEAAYLTVEQVRTLLAAADGSRYRPVFRLLVNTGLRRGEALALRWADVDFDGRLLRVRGTLARVDGDLVVTEVKTAKSNRVIHMTPTTEATLKSVKVSQSTERLRAGSVWTQTGYVFTTETGQPCDPRNALRALKAAANKAELPGVGLHTLRHSAASVMLSSGVPLKVVSEVLGHASIAITGDVYGHVSPEVARDALDGLSVALDA